MILLAKKLKLKAPIDWTVRYIVIDRLGEAIDMLHDDAADSTVEYKFREAADFISEIRKELQR